VPACLAMPSVKSFIHPLKLSMKNMQPPQTSLIYPHVIIGPLKMST